MTHGVNDVCKQTMNTDKTPGFTTVISFHSELEASVASVRDQHNYLNYCEFHYYNYSLYLSNNKIFQNFLIT